uniref:Uncharacterized protein n=1 Tax=Rhizophora mucronata TaxID=61149 RepID=A0A2P2Q8T6_RHIMU
MRVQLKAQRWLFTEQEAQIA